MDYAIQVCVVISAIGCVFAFRQHKQIWPLIVGLASAAMVFFAYYVNYRVALIYTGLAGLVVAAIGNIIAKRKARSCCDAVQLQSIITCPKCGHQKEETMPTDACLHFYECEKCHATLRPKPGDCCIFCSFGSVNVRQFRRRVKKNFSSRVR